LTNFLPQNLTIPRSYLSKETRNAVRENQRYKLDQRKASSTSNSHLVHSRVGVWASDGTSRLAVKGHPEGVVPAEIFVFLNVLFDTVHYHHPANAAKLPLGKVSLTEIQVQLLVPTPPALGVWVAARPPVRQRPGRAFFAFGYRRRCTAGLWVVTGSTMFRTERRTSGTPA
jgi:hypothetical protein